MLDIEMRMIPDYEDLYAATKDGRIWSYRSNKFLKQSINNCGYCKVGLVKDGKQKTALVHRCVMLAWCPGEGDVNHKDENKLNNNLENLEWLSRRDNINYGTRTQRQRETYLSHRKKIGQYDATTNKLIAIYDTQTQAAAANDGVWQGNLSNALKKGNTCGGYIWKYLEN
ncbi:MAG: HNH endonuclease [Prevotellaceae bacterium]|nr:HNH endonuclease [Candidatus Faecinaster equi]